VIQQSQLAAPTQSIFGGGVANIASTNVPATSTTGGGSLFSGSSFNTPKTSQGTPIFGGTAAPMQKSGNIFGAIGSGASVFSFATAAKDLDNSESAKENTTADPTTTTTTTSMFKTDSSLSFGALAAAATAKTNDLSRDQSSKSPDFLNVNNSLSFASLAAKGDNNGGFLEGGTNNSEFKGFKGLTIKEDIFSKLANKSMNASTDPNTSSGGGDDAAATDDNYDPHYDPVIQLPDEIVVKTGEEEEEKLFSDRAKLFRYDPNTKEWKERGE
jgi:E3 SUMO-protein ligase RanBP2